MTTTEAQTPAYDRRTIREYLDSGGDPAQHPEAHTLVEVVAYHRLVERDHRLNFARLWLAEIVEKGLGALPPVAEGVEPVAKDADWIDRMTYSLSHEVELLTDDDLADRFEAGLPAEQVAEHRAAAANYRDMENKRFRVELRPMKEGYHCWVTGSEIFGCDALVLIDRYEEIDEITISPEAIRAVLR